MKQKILKIVNDIKSHLKDIDNDGVYHSALEDIYDSLSLIEDVIYDDDMNVDPFDIEDEEDRF
jgi:hypothetical protein